ncbi:unnamed protein product [Gongylonema pulchrum]|uniref:Uncharacterized protein n=1 Tax=Gongylonema pulchrum TaxID=637853 RepID=A0A183EFW0_9BILA|nr:unnamed protein product [Gongylonema pulchrum]
MQQGGGQMMRAVMIQQGSPYDQANYIVPAGAGTTMQRTSDPYGIPQAQTGVCFFFLPPAVFLPGFFSRKIFFHIKTE